MIPAEIDCHLHASEATVRRAVIAIRRLLAGYVYITTSEAQLQSQVMRALIPLAGTSQTEVVVTSGRLDILVTYSTPLGDTARIALELKVGGGVAAVERQAMRYARSGVDAVGVVTTSATLAAKLGLGHQWTGRSSRLSTFGGVPYFVVALRSF